MRAVGAWVRPRWLPGGAQAVSQHEVLPVHRQSMTASETADHANVSVPGPDDVPDDAADSQQPGFWSRLKSPSRFLMPRTDAWLGSEDSESSQDFDSGF